MNLRQKAKHYKKELQRLQDILNPKMCQKIITEEIPVIENIAVVRLIDENYPFDDYSEYFKCDIASQIGNYIIDNKLCTWRLDESTRIYKRLIVRAKVIKPKEAIVDYEKME